MHVFKSQVDHPAIFRSVSFEFLFESEAFVNLLFVVIKIN